MPIFKRIDRIALYIEAETHEDAADLLIGFNTPAESYWGTAEKKPELISWEWHSTGSIEREREEE